MAGTRAAILRSVDVDRYLDRIGAARPGARSAESLCELHRAHMLRVPFESYDCALGRPVVTDPEANYRKIVERRRGGFCFELNGLFARLLDELGFPVTILSARPFIVGREAEAEPEFAHMTLLVEADGVRWLADVGYGDSFIEPLRLDVTGDQVRELGRAYRVTPGSPGERWRLVQVFGGEHAEGYLFSLESRRLADFDGMCRFYSTSSDSPFVTSPICSLATEAGRVTVVGRRRLIEHVLGIRTERELADEVEERAVLAERFGVDLDGV